MKTNRLSALEKLEIKRAYLKAEEQSHLDGLNKHINYLQNHWGSLLINSGIDVFKSWALPLVQPFLGNKNITEEQDHSSMSSVYGFSQKYPHLSTAVSQLIDILPMFIKGPKALISVFVLKSVKDFLFTQNSSDTKK